MIARLQSRAEFRNGFSAPYRCLMSWVKSYLRTRPDISRPHGGEEYVGCVGATERLRVVDGVEREVLLVRLASD